jgi:hypothetical protein
VLENQFFRSRFRRWFWALEFYRANAAKRTGSGVVCIRTRVGCSGWESEPGRRVPPGYGSASFPFRPPNWAGHLHPHPQAFFSRCSQVGGSGLAQRATANDYSQVLLPGSTGQQLFLQGAYVDHDRFHVVGGQGLHSGRVLRLLRNGLGQVGV